MKKIFSSVTKSPGSLFIPVGLWLAVFGLGLGVIATALNTGELLFLGMAAALGNSAP